MFANTQSVSKTKHNLTFRMGQKLSPKLLFRSLWRTFYWATLYRLCTLYASARPSVRLSVTRVDQSKTVEVRIMKFLPTVAPSL